MDADKKRQIIERETGMVDRMNNAELMFNFAKIKAMNMTANNQDDKDITFFILEKMQNVMKKRGIMIETHDLADNVLGMRIQVPASLKHEPEKVTNIKAPSKRQKTSFSDLDEHGKYTTSSADRDTLTFHTLMNLNEARLTKEGEINH